MHTIRDKLKSEQYRLRCDKWKFQFEHQHKLCHFMKKWTAALPSIGVKKADFKRISIDDEFDG